MEKCEFCVCLKPMFWLFTRACLLYKTSKNGLFYDLFWRSMTWEYSGLPGITGGYKGWQGVTMGYKGLQGDTGGYKGLQGVTGGYKGLPGVTRE